MLLPNVYKWFGMMALGWDALPVIMHERPLIFILRGAILVLPPTHHKLRLRMRESESWIIYNTYHQILIKKRDLLYSPFKKKKKKAFVIKIEQSIVKLKFNFQIKSPLFTNCNCSCYGRIFFILTKIQHRLFQLVKRFKTRLQNVKTIRTNRGKEYASFLF